VIGSVCCCSHREVIALCCRWVQHTRTHTWLADPHPPSAWMLISWWSHRNSPCRHHYDYLVLVSNLIPLISLEWSRPINLIKDRSFPAMVWGLSQEWESIHCTAGGVKLIRQLVIIIPVLPCLRLRSWWGRLLK
jgi:hypothetical protein